MANDESNGIRIKMNYLSTILIHYGKSIPNKEKYYNINCNWKDGIEFISFQILKQSFKPCLSLEHNYIMI